MNDLNTGSQQHVEKLEQCLQASAQENERLNTQIALLESQIKNI